MDPIQEHIILKLAQARYTVPEIVRDTGHDEIPIWQTLLRHGYDYDMKTGAIRKADTRGLVCQVLFRLLRGESINKISRALRVGNDVVFGIKNIGKNCGFKFPVLKAGRRAPQKETR